MIDSPSFYASSNSTPASSHALWTASTPTETTTSTLETFNRRPTYANVLAVSTWYPETSRE